MIVLVTVVTVMTDLATAVVVGVTMSALAYAWQGASRIHAKTYVTPEGAKVYRMRRPRPIDFCGFSSLPQRRVSF